MRNYCPVSIYLNRKFSLVGGFGQVNMLQPYCNRIKQKRASLALTLSFSAWGVLESNQ